MDATIAHEAGSRPRLHRRLSPFGVLLLTLSCLSPVFSVYGPGADVLQHAGTGAALLFIIGIAAAIVWALIYAELGSAYPYAGGDYVGVGSILGPGIGFACLASWAAFVIPSTAFLAKVVATYAGQVAPSVPENLVTFGSLAIAVGIALLAVRTSAVVTGLFLTIEALAVIVLIVAGLWHSAHGLSAHGTLSGLAAMIRAPRVPDATAHWVPVAAGTLAAGAVNAAYATVGGNQAIAFGEELLDPHRNMGRVILIACLVGAAATALPVIAVALSASQDPAIFRSPAPFSAFMASIAGHSAGVALSASVALAIFNALIAQMMFNARLFFSFARDRVFPSAINSALASVHASSGAPRTATVAVGILSAACCLLSEHALLVFVSGLVVYSLGLVSLAVMIGRRRGLTARPGYWRSSFFPLAPVLGLALTIVFAIADWADADAGRPSLLVLGAIFLGALLWHRRVLKNRAGGWTPRLD